MWPQEMRELQTKATTQGKVEACTVGCTAHEYTEIMAVAEVENDEEKIVLMFYYNIYHD